MNNKQTLTTLILTAGLLVACSSDDDNVVPAASQRPISVEVGMTRAAITTTQTLSNFSMSGVYSGTVSAYTITKSGDTWPISPVSWPSAAGNDDVVPFYAYTGGTYYYNSGNPYVSYTVPENASTQHDLLVATNNVAYSDRNGKVSLTFDHACAAVEFNVCMTNTLKKQLDDTPLTISSIVLHNVYSKGKYYFATGWQELSEQNYYTLNDADITVTTTPQPLSSNYLFMIPQQRAKDGTSGVYLEVTYAFAGQTQTTAIIPLDTNDWLESSTNTIDIKLGTTLIK